MFKALGRYLRAFGYLITGRIDSARKELSKNPYVVQATYDKIIEEKTKRIQQFKDAVARMIAQEEKKIAKIKGLTDEVNKLEQLKEGAAAKARLMITELKNKGLSLEQIKLDPEYQKCLTAFNDFTSTSAEKSEHILELEKDVQDISSSVGNHKVQLQSIMRELDKIKQESHEAVADMITAKEEEEIADMISGISDDRTSKELQEMRDLRHEMKASARISREMAGTDTAAVEAEFMEYARTSSSNDEFEKLIGLAEATDEGAPIVDEPQAEQADTQLPE